MGDLRHALVDVKEEHEQDEEQQRGQRDGALIGEVDPGGGACGLIGVELDQLALFLHGADHLGRGVLAHHEAQVEEALADAVGQRVHEAHQSGGHAFHADVLGILHMVDGVAGEAHHGVDVEHGAHAAETGTGIDRHGAAGAEEGDQRAHEGDGGAENDHLGAAELFDEGQHDKEHRAHRRHGDHGEAGLDGGRLAVGVAGHDPAGVVDLRNALEGVEYLIDENQDDKHDPVLVLEAGLELGAEAGFLDLDQFALALGNAALFGDTLTGVEVLDEGQRHGDGAHDGERHQIALLVAAHAAGNHGQDRREQDGDDAGADVLGDLARDGVAGALLDVAGGERRGQLICHVPHGVAHGIEQVIGDHDPDSLSLGTHIRDGKHHDDAGHRDGQGQDEPGTQLALAALGIVQYLGHQNVGDGVQQLTEHREHDHKACDPHAAADREAQGIGQILVEIAVDNGLEQHHAEGTGHIAQPALLAVDIGGGDPGVPERSFKPAAQKSFLCFCTHVHPPHQISGIGMQPQ